MATILDLILSPALRKLGVPAPTLPEKKNALHALNRMLASWGANEFLVYAVTRENFTLTIGDAEYTIGSSGDMNTVRPIKITDAFLRDSSTDYELDVATVEEYNDVMEKTTEARPMKLIYLPEYPLGRILFDYEPDKAYVLYINSLKRITAFAKITTAVSLPEEYELALIFNLTIHLASEFDHKLSSDVFVIANDSKKAIMNLNASVRPSPPSKADRAITFPLSR